MGERKLEGSTVVVIGGASGIGLACAEAAHGAGAAVTIAGRSAGKLERAKAGVVPNARVAALDVTEEAAVRGLFSGFERVDHLVVAAAETAAAGIAEAEEADVRPTLDIRVCGEGSSRPSTRRP